jgi:hypothetical protein
MLKRIVIGVVALVIVAGVGGGAFYAGMQYQQSQAASVQQRFFADRGGAPPANFAGGAGLAGGRGTVGDIKSIDGMVLTLSTPQSEVKVTLSDSTQVLKLVAGGTADLQVGQRVTVRGEADSSGNVAASAIQITDNAQTQP